VHLKQLDLLGFKSFANKTTIKCSNGITAIVGPNGCGKTNVLDALRWVLGEQKASLLRGGKMEEVIFNGTREAKPLGMAEVTLTITNDRGMLPTEYNEIQVTRRLFRSGESEYLLNKVPCRLKDITDLFVDTGMGTHSYSVIQQEMIDAVISDRAEERRFLFEEAAGITKYKLRRKAAQRKLEATENDLLRLNDIFAEVKTRATSLYRQHKKAERYQKVVEEIRNWELYLSATRIKNIEHEKRGLKGTFDSLTNQKLDRETRLNELSAHVEAERKGLLDLERQLNEIGSGIYTSSEKAHSLEREISILTEKQTNARKLIEKNETDIEALKVRLDSLATQMETAHCEAEAQAAIFQETATRLSEAETVQAEADRHLLGARSAREEKNHRMIELEGKLSSGRTEGSNLQQQEDELTGRIGTVDEQMTTLQPRQGELLSKLEKQRRSFDELSDARDNADLRKSELAVEMNRLVKYNEELSLEISNLTASIEDCEARRKLLEEMILHYEGYESGVLAAMTDRDRWPGIMGTVAERFIPTEGMEVAVEAALGDIARFLICHDRQAAVDIIQCLKSEKKGKIGILVPDTGTINPAVRRPELDMPEVLGWLDGFVSTDENLRPLKDAVLSRTVVFKAGANPDPILELLPYGFTAVSTDGDVYGRNFISGGSDDRFPLFRRKEKVQEQEGKIAELNSRLSQVTEDKNRTVARLAAARGEFSQLNSHLEELSEEIESTRQEISESDFEHRSLTSDIERLQNEKLTLSEKLRLVRDHRDNLHLDFSQLSSLKDNLVEEMNEDGTKLANLERRAAEAVDRVSNLQVKSIETKSKVEQATSRINHLRELESDIKNNFHTKTDEIETNRSDITLAAQRIANLEKDLKTAFQNRDEEKDRQEKIREIQAEITKRISDREMDIKRIRNERDELSEQLHEVEIRLNTIDSEIRSISDRIREEYEIDIHAAAVSIPNEKLSDDERRGHLQELKERLKKFGAVNLLAMEEYREASEREKFLSEQLADLTTAKSDLQATITKIDQTARQLFSETLKKVQANFSSLFVELFTGGEADIKLIDPDDPLESDIEITARPHGKRLLAITQMSGGERALTAIALLFSLYLVKPSPFCILDEIDAPLDDANCHRFLKLITSFSKNTQFIIITHNKITMEAADNLYGITMEQPGISALVAVRFTDDGDGTGPTRVKTVADEPHDISNGIETRADDLPEEIRKRIDPELSVTRNDDA